MSYSNYLDYLKFPSGRSVGNSRKDAKKLSSESGVSLTIALNETAKANGIPCDWDAAISILLNESLQRSRISREKLTVEAIESISKRHPSLTQFGLGLLSTERASHLALSVEEYRQQEHNSILLMLNECQIALAFVSLLVPQREVNNLSLRTSNELKHIAERAYSYVSPGMYIHHGAFIVAALFQGFLPQRCSPYSLSTFFNISEDSPILHWNGSMDDPIASELKNRLDFYSQL